MLTDSELAEIEGRVKNAVGSPWIVYHEPPVSPHKYNHNRSVWASCVGEYSICDLDGANSEHDADFIAHSPEDVRRLLETVRSLQTENARLRDSLEDMVLCAESHGWDNAEIHNARTALAGGGTEEERK